MGADREAVRSSIPCEMIGSRSYLKGLLPGKWQKAIKKAEFRRDPLLRARSGRVADVKFFPLSTGP